MRTNAHMHAHTFVQDGLANALATLLLDVSGDLGPGPELYRQAQLHTHMHAHARIHKLQPKIHLLGQGCIKKLLFNTV